MLHPRLRVIPPPFAAEPAVSPDFKEEMLASLRTEMAAVFKTELHEALKDNLSSIKAELQTVMADLSVSITNIKSDITASRNNVRIVGVPEETTNTTAAISTLLKEAFKLEKEPLLDRAHRTLQPKPRPGEPPAP
ncbi:hypothetical protein KUCAC02_018135 [Chaenocephalus aceratus]|uniref:Uncharacterized protein n=1 Tax=Chaenocephalus aceratus TaxID=36190 RepID=A0ACB9W8A3_CHAAC|nr:hypothetical protein KUCAC02_018135 [Chaenocephalus aceratus]